MPQQAPYGSWKSPVTSDLIVAGMVGLGGLRVERDDVYWIESRPSEGGRSVLVRLSPGAEAQDVTPAPFNVRTRVHEYGGGAYTVHNGTVYFSNFADQRVYRQEQGGEPQAITPEESLRYADAVLDGRNLVCVCEDHRGEGEPVNYLVSVPCDGAGEPQVLTSGYDFYSNPRISPDGKRLAWLCWSHPNMPWDGTELWLAEYGPDGLVNPRQIAGGVNESIFQPEWSPDGTLHFISDRSGWWNLYRRQEHRTEALYLMDAEFGVPQWVFGQTTYAFLDAHRIACIYSQDGIDHLAILDTGAKELTPVSILYTALGSISATGEKLLFNAASPTTSPAIVRLDLKTGSTEVLKRSSTISVDPAYVSQPEPVDFPTGGGKTAHGIYYPPTNSDFEPPAGERPPLLVLSHGGPTGNSSAVLSYGIQFWTSRGIAVLDVNYGGSTGYGREYRERLKGQWGIVDVDDCGNGAQFLVKRGDVDGSRLAIRGGSAGGYTTLCALTFRDVFRAGASHYGVSDLTALARDTHKFESRYLDSLIGPYPEREDLYRERSPINHTDQLSCPLIVFQGLEDRMVPPNQAELMVDAVRRRGLPVAYVAFEGEQHGFRQAKNIKRALDSELYFYSRIFGFTLADPVEPVEIENLPE